MKRGHFLIYVCLFLACIYKPIYSFAQNQKTIDSLKAVLNDKKTPDSTKINIYDALGKLYYTTDLDKAIEINMQGIAFSKKINHLKGQALLWHFVGMYQNFKGNNDKSIFAFLESLALSEKTQYLEMKGANLSRIADINREQGNLLKSQNLHNQAIEMLRKTNNKLYLTNSLHRRGLLYRDKKEYEKALKDFREAAVLAKEMKSKNQTALCALYIGEVLVLQQKDEEAQPYFETTKALSSQINNKITLSRVSVYLAKIFFRKNQVKEAMNHYFMALSIAKEAKAQNVVKDAYFGLYEIYKSQQKIDSALYYFEKNVSVKDSIYNQDKDKLINFYMTDADIERQKIELSKNQVEIEKKNLYIYLAGIVIVFILIIAGILYRNNQRKEKAYQLLQIQKEEISTQKEQIEEQNLNLQSLNKEIRHQKEEIESFSNHLEALVEERSNKLIERNKQLTEYAFFNAHKLRSPIATILGLYEVLKLDLSQEERESIFEKMKTTIVRLDEMVKQSQQLLDDGDEL